MVLAQDRKTMRLILLSAVPLERCARSVNGRISFFKKDTGEIS